MASRKPIDCESNLVVFLSSSILGLGVGFGLAIDPLYISEMTPAAHRGELVTWSEMAINVGLVLGFLSGIVFNDFDDNLEWRLMFAMGAILPFVLILVSEFLMAESPRWLVSKERHEEAKAILRKIYPDGTCCSVCNMESSPALHHRTKSTQHVHSL